MKLRLFPVVAVVALWSLFYGCGGEPPTADLNAAQQALQDAKAAGAEKYASSQLSTAQSAYDKAQSALTAEQDKFFKNFDEVSPLIADAKSKAEAAKAAVLQAKEQAKREADAMVSDAAAVVQKARSVLDGTPAGKGTESDVEQLRAELNAAEADLSAARSAVSSENFDTAKSRAASAKEKAGKVASGTEMAIARYNELKDRADKTTFWYMQE